MPSGSYGGSVPLIALGVRTPAPRPQPVSVSLSVMSLNIFYGGDDYDLATGDWCPVADGCPNGLRKLARLIRASGADVVGLQEAERNTQTLATAARLARGPARAGDLALPPPATRRRSGALHVRRAGAGPDRGGGEHAPALHAVRPLPGAARGSRGRRCWRSSSGCGFPRWHHVLRVLPRLAARGIPVFLTGDFNSPSHLDWTRAVADARADVPYPVRWPASAALAEAGFVDSYRSVHPDPVADPGFTWTPGGPEARTHDVFDRIDWVLSAGPATAVSSRLVGETGNPQVDVATPGRFPTDHRGVVSTFEVVASGGAAERVAVGATRDRRRRQPVAGPVPRHRRRGRGGRGRRPLGGRCAPSSPATSEDRVCHLRNLARSTPPSRLIRGG